MAPFRARLRLWATLWLICQAASLAAFVPRDCCADHRPVQPAPAPEAESAHCHEPPPAAETHCPMRAADGTPCPMHRGHGHQQQPAGDTDCALRGACGGPMTALVRLLSNHGILPESSAIGAPVAQRTLPPADERLVSRLDAPDSPPPRL